MARYDDQRANVFLVLWTLSVAATTVCLLFYLGVRVESIELGYELGKSHAELSRLREVERVLELELSAHETPERVDLVGRTLFGMQEPSPERVYPAGADPEPGQPQSSSGRTEREASASPSRGAAQARSAPEGAP